MEEKDFVFLFKTRTFIKNASWIAANCFRDEIQKTFSSELKTNEDYESRFVWAPLKTRKQQSKRY